MFGGPLVWAVAHFSFDASLVLAIGSVLISVLILLITTRLGHERDDRRTAETLTSRHVSFDSLSQLQAAIGQVAAAEVALELEHARAQSLEQQLTACQADLDEARASRGAFLATVSHELRTPLHAIVGFTELVSDGSAGPVNEAQKEYLTDARAAGQHLMRLISDVLDFAKAEAGRLPFVSDPVAVGPVVEEVLSLVQALAAKKELLVEASVEEGLVLTGDALRLKQVLLNLVANAVKFTPRRGKVAVTARAEGDECVLSVVDTGPGIALEDRDRIFEPFHHGDSTARVQGGTGLGLALVKRWTQAMRGSVRLVSELGQGASFSVHLPRHSNVAALRKIELEPTPQVDVLVAEDDDATRVMVARVLESRGCSVRQAPNGQRALEALMERLPSVLVLDLMMPELDGFDLLKKLRALAGGERVAVMVFSASAIEGAERSRLEALGAEVLLKGSLSPTELANRVLAGRAVRAAA